MFNSRFTDDDALVLQPFATEGFPNILGRGAFDGDDFALAVARVLLKPRIPEGITVTISVWDYSPGVVFDYDEKNSIQFFYYKDSDADHIRDEESSFKHTDGWKEFVSEKISLLASQLGVKFSAYKNAERRATVVFTDVNSYSNWHYLSTIIDTLYLDGPYERTAEEQELFKAFVSGDKNRISNELDNITRGLMDVELAKKKYYLTGYEQSIVDNKRDYLEEQRTKLANEINDTTNRLNTLYELYNESMVMIAALDNNEAEGKDELLQYFLENKNVFIHSKRDDGLITYITTGYITLFDSEVVKEYLDNPRSVLYNSVPNFSPTVIKKLITGIFIDEKVKVRVCSAWSFSAGGVATPSRCFRFGKQFSNYLPNPHLDNYGCVGSWQQALDEAACKMDYAYMVDVTSAENTNLNFNDTTVIRVFMESIMDRDVKVLELPTGEVVNYEDAVKWMYKEESDG